VESRIVEAGSGYRSLELPAVDGPPPPPSPGPAVDVLVCFDTTRSMEYWFDPLTERLSELAEWAVTQPIDVRWGLVAFGDLRVPGDGVASYPFTRDPRQFAQALREMPIFDGGPNVGESCFDAVGEAAGRADRRPEATCVCLLITDGAGDGSRFGLQSLGVWLRERRVELYLMAPSYREYRWLAAVSGGALVHLVDPAPLTGLLMELARGGRLTGPPDWSPPPRDRWAGRRSGYEGGKLVIFRQPPSSDPGFALMVGELCLCFSVIAVFCGLFLFHDPGRAVVFAMTVLTFGLPFFSGLHLVEGALGRLATAVRGSRRLAVGIACGLVAAVPLVAGAIYFGTTNLALWLLFPAWGVAMVGLRRRQLMRTQLRVPKEIARREIRRLAIQSLLIALGISAILNGVELLYGLFH
jgi:hypothetical protein